MLFGLRRADRGAGSSSGFKAYLSNLQRETRAGTPTVREAKRDYRAITRSQNTAWTDWIV